MPKSRTQFAAVPPTPRLALSISEFCKAHCISEGFFYKLKKQGEGPREMKVGARTLITFELRRNGVARGKTSTAAAAVSCRIAENEKSGGAVPRRETTPLIDASNLDGCRVRAPRGPTSEIQRPQQDQEVVMHNDFVEHDLETPTEADLDQAYGSKYLSATDVGNRKIRTTIVKVRKADLRRGDGTKPIKFVLHFEHIDKPMVINATNKNELVKKLGRIPPTGSARSLGSTLTPMSSTAGRPLGACACACSALRRRPSRRDRRSRRRMTAPALRTWATASRSRSGLAEAGCSPPRLFSPFHPSPEIQTLVMSTAIVIPACLEPLTHERRWLVWRREQGRGGRLTKVPYRADQPPSRASCNDPATWCSFETAMRAYLGGGVDGIAFALMGSNVAAFDVDHCRDAASGALHVWAQQLVARCGSYVEITPSSEGIQVPRHGQRPENPPQIYPCRRCKCRGLS